MSWNLSGITSVLLTSSTSISCLKDIVRGEINRTEIEKLPMFVVVGNKNDDENRRAVEKEDGESQDERDNNIGNKL